METRNDAALSPARVILLCCLLAALTFLAFAPSLRGGFLWDDDAYITSNPLITAADGLWRIWFSRDAPSQYFPLVYSMFRAEHGLWGPNPLGYRLVNLLLHLANAVLLWDILRRLGLRGAWVAAAVFAVHPVQVESVAWIAERKNTLSVFFYLLSAREWVAHVSDGGRTGVRYLRSLAWFIPALLSKTTTATLPAAMLLTAWFVEGRVSRRRVNETAPFWVAGGAMGLFTIWWESVHQGTVGGEFAAGPAERVLVVGRGIWFYLGKILWPADLSFSYQRWEPAANSPGGWVWLLTAAAVLAGCWTLRTRFGRGPFAGFAFFLITLAPLLGFIPLYTFRYTFFADHYQYLALAGPVALAAHGAACGVAVMPGGKRTMAAFAAILLLLLTALSAQRSRAFLSSESLWADVLSKDSRSWLALFNLARLRAEDGRLEEAATLLARSLAVRPSTEAEQLLGSIRALQGDIGEAIGHYREAIRLFSDNAFAHNGLGLLLEAQGDIEGALRHFSEAVRTYPRSATARTNLANLLTRLGRLEEAETQYRTALEVYPGFPPALLNYGRFLDGLGRKGEAVPLLERYASSLPGEEREAFRRTFGL